MFIHDAPPQVQNIWTRRRRDAAERDRLKTAADGNCGILPAEIGNNCGKVPAVFQYFCGNFPATLPIHMHVAMVNAGIENEAKKVAESVIWIDMETGKSDNFAENKITT